jgi:Flp pilus assembly protein TadD
LERAVALKPDFAQAHSNLGVARSRAGDSAGAIRAYRDALRCNPGDANAHIALAEELANAGELNEAKEHIARATALNPKDSRLPAARAQLGLKP